MINPELLEELVSFKKYGTLSATAEHLLITQPSVTRGMKKLEQELGVTLFNRSANKIELTATGNLAAQEAEKLLKSQEVFIEKVINFDKSQQSIKLGSVAPGPLLFIQSEYDQNKFEQKLTFNHQLVTPEDVTSDLLTYKEQIVFSHQEIQTKEIESLYLGSEQLSVRIDKFNPLSQQKSVSFADLAGVSFLVAQDIGPWKNICETYIPKAKFLYQDDLNSLDELTRYSNFPVFRSNLTRLDQNRNENDNRKEVQISDEHNFLPIYASYLKYKENKARIKPFLQKLIKIWPK
ncbi:LysR family transcriptional regulator [Lactobacillus rodentium]|uniref:LysR family transcriptional regulator n=1 Tax=Lactobacillus rodentium TaxID=947835 RepID=A0A2Z6TED4_9LACO|nr:LysR family transcriptional regulator [Lactobacillus rodentium]MCR1894057.1 LysR family transcriptional regulator [Lactobacillus rodentium]GBG04352.1 LysR family transcriptional regulator [Lactobacillus rodentium]